MKLLFSSTLTRVALFEFVIFCVSYQNSCDVRFDIVQHFNHAIVFGQIAKYDYQPDMKQTN